MRFCVLMGSPRPKGNTASLLAPFTSTLLDLGAEVETIHLYDLNILPCNACRVCQEIRDSFGCPLKDDMQGIFDSVLASDCMVLATPIYSWSCTPPLKSVLDRLIYGMNKFYGLQRYGALWKGKGCAIISSSGYPPEKGSDLFAQGIDRYCKHSSLLYHGALAVRDRGYQMEFVTENKLASAREFAQELHNRMLLPDEGAQPIWTPVYV